MNSKRSDIQGLRGLCVAAVCIFHAFPHFLPGGFLGVDIFFVISGFLITRILVAEIETTGTIQIFRFWARRAQRLLPNACLTLGATLLATLVLLPPYRLQAVSGDLISAAAFYSNFHFAQRAVDYFSADDVVSPVLHFWSLSLEEQFYLSLPIVLLVIATVLPKSVRRHIVLALLITTAIFSLSYCIIAAHLSQPIAFFHFAPRVWQLILGGIVGTREDFLRDIFRRHLRPILLCSVVTLTACLVCYSSALSYPGIWAVPPVLATSAILCLTPNTRLEGILSVRPLVWIGDRSYSFYLWHFPYLAISGEVWPGNSIAKCLAIVGFAVTAPLVFPIEDRIRRARFALPPLAKCLLGAAYVALFCGLCTLLTHRPLPPLSASRLAEITRASSDVGRTYADHCHLLVEDTVQPPCIYGSKDGSRTVYLFGDSHAAMWFTPLAQAARLEGWKLVVRTRSSCPAVLVSIVIPYLKSYYRNCDVWRQAVIDEISREHPDLVVVSDYGNYYNWLYDRASHAVLDTSESRKAWAEGTVRLIRSIPRNIHIAIMRDTPTQLKSYKDCASYRSDCGRSRDAAMEQMEPINKSALNDRIRLIDLTDLICSSSFCPVMKNGAVIYHDNHHLTATFTGSLYSAFTDILRSNQISYSPKALSN